MNWTEVYELPEETMCSNWVAVDNDTDNDYDVMCSAALAFHLKKKTFTLIFKLIEIRLCMEIETKRHAKLICHLKKEPSDSLKI